MVVVNERSDETRPDPGWWNADREEWPDRVVVMRHASHRHGLVGEQGREQIEDVAKALAEWCHFTGSEVEHFDAFTTDDRVGHEVVATASLMRRLVDDELRRLRGLPIHEPVRRVEQLDSALVPVYPRDVADGDRAPRLVVLNEPQVGEFVNALSGTRIELRHAEIVLLERARHVARVGGLPFFWVVPYRARWTMAPKVPEGDPTRTKILAKIAGKMHTAGVLGGLITTLLTFVLTQLFTDDIPWGDATFASLVALSISATLFFVAMFYYDSLTMPSEFWGPRARWSRWHRPWSRSAKRPTTPGWLLARPPSGTSRVLQLNMVRIWTWIFRPAIFGLGIGVAALLLAADDDGASAARPVELDGTHAVILAAATLVTAWWSWHFRPQIGSSD